MSDTREFELRTKVGEEWATLPIAIRTDFDNDIALEMVLRRAYRTLEAMVTDRTA